MSATQQAALLAVLPLASTGAAGSGSGSGSGIGISFIVLAAARPAG